MQRTFIAQCEQEALQHSGAIQAHGTLIALGPDLRPTHVAANVGAWLGGRPESWLHQPLPTLLQHWASGLPAQAGSRLWVEGQIQGVQHCLDLTLNRAPDGGILLELTPTAAPEETPPASEPAPTELLSHRHQLLERIAHQTGAQRVLYYAFEASGDGAVQDEVRQGEAYGSYLGLHFPPSDIPQIARALYLKNPWRLIVDARAQPVPLLGTGAPPPDLSHSDLRSVSPVHQIYMANMGVVGALSFPVVIAGKLEALISAHSNNPLHPRPGQLDTLSTEVRRFSLKLTALRAQARMRMIDNLERHFQHLEQALQRHGHLHGAWDEFAPRLQSDFHCDGVMLCSEQHLLCHGHGLHADALHILDTWFRAQTGEQLWSCTSLGQQLPGFPLSEIAGVMALKLPLGTGSGLRIYLTRCEHIHEIAWGGNPDKPLEYHDGQLGITPRRSFENWIEQRLGHSRPWDNETRLLGLKLREFLLKILQKAALG